jgi:polysaccharide biosynthesis/export protein
MNALLQVLPAGGWERLAADALWQSSALAAVGLLVAWLLRHRAALRAAVLLSAAMLSVVAPLLSMVVRATGVGALAHPIAAQPAKLASVDQLAENDRSPAERDEWVAGSLSDSFGKTAFETNTFADTPATKSSWSPARAWPWLVGAWLAASGLLALRLMRGLACVRRAIGQAEPCTDPVIRAALARAAASVSVRLPEVFHSHAFATPALIALLRPRLFVPREMPDGVDWFAICCHELAHLARRDGASRLAVELCIVALPWQPLLWLARRQFRSACEEACDDWAVASGADPVEFAALLVSLVPNRPVAFTLGMAESSAATRRRIVRLLAMKGSIQPRLGFALGMVGWGLAIGLAVAVALLQSNSARKPSDPIQLPTNWTTSNPGTLRIPAWGDKPLADAIAQAAAALPKAAGPPPPYVIAVPDILLIDAIKVVPKAPYHIEPLDMLQIVVANPLLDLPISGSFAVDPSGMIDLGPPYGKVMVSGQTVDEAKKAIEDHLKSIIRDPQIAVSLSQTSGQQQITGEHHIGPDGRVNLGTYGSVYVAGMTIAEATKAIEEQLSKYLEQPRVSVDVFAYNSKVYYVIVEGDVEGDSIVRSPITGNETVLDALAQRAEKIPSLADSWVWVARAGGIILPVNWQGLVEGTDTTSNWQLQPGDRIVVRSKPRP